MDSESQENAFVTASYDNKSEHTDFFTIVDNMPTLIINLLNQFNNNQDIRSRIHTNLMIIAQVEYPTANKGWLDNMSHQLWTRHTPHPDENADFNKFVHKIGMRFLELEVRRASTDLVPAYKDKTISLYDLNKELNAVRFAEILGVSIQKNIAKDLTPEEDIFFYPEHTWQYKKLGRQPQFRPVCDTDPEFDPTIHPYKITYNGKMYDLTIWSLIMDEMFGGSNKETGIVFRPMKASQIRLRNDELFSPEIKDYMPNRTLMSYKATMPPKLDIYKRDYNSRAYRIYQGMVRSGRFVDMMFLNDSASMRYAPLKQIFALRGYQIRESDRLSGDRAYSETFQDLVLLHVYNLTDTFYEDEVINDDTPYRNDRPTYYKGTFETKQALLFEYKDIVYQVDPQTNEPIVDKNHVKQKVKGSTTPDRSFIDMTSANHSVNLLAPNEPLKDIRTLDFMFPAQSYLDRNPDLNLKSIDILDAIKKQMEKMFTRQPHVLKEFQPIYDYFRSFEGKNFNNSEQYRRDWGEEVSPSYFVLPDELQPLSIYDIPTPPQMFMHYYFKNGEPSGSVCVFGLGGIHGQELNKWLYSASKRALSGQQALFDKAKEAFNDDAIALRQSAHKNPHLPQGKENKKEWVTIEGQEFRYQTFLKGGKPIAKSEWKELPEVNWHKVSNAGGRTRYEIMDKWKFTSVGWMNHEDFSSYYPSILRLMDTFYNMITKQDRLGELYDLKESLGQMIKETKKKGDTALMAMFGVKREGTKLGLNSPTGKAGTMTGENNIRTNNGIAKMRIIGQLFSFIIGQMQAYEGARIPSTNTDGLFTIMREDLNNTILEDASTRTFNIGIKIEPERAFVISKDTNNRVEFTSDDYETSKVIASGGASTGAYFGVPLTKSIDHPALIDWLLVEYMKYKTMVDKDLLLIQPFDRTLAYKLLNKAKETFTHPGELLHRLQHIISSKNNAQTTNFYYFLRKPDSTDPKDIINIQKQNRIYYVKDDVEVDKRISPNGTNYLRQASLRVPTGKNPSHDLPAIQVLRHHGVTEIDYNGKYAMSPKISGYNPNSLALQFNEDLWHLDPEVEQNLIDAIDWDVYVNLLADAYATWQNEIPEEELDDALTVVSNEAYYEECLAKGISCWKEKEVIIGG